LDISLIIPAKDEEQSIAELTQWISRVMQTHGFSYEVIYIDDGSDDGTADIARKAGVTVFSDGTLCFTVYFAVVLVALKALCCRVSWLDSSVDFF